MESSSTRLARQILSGAAEAVSLSELAARVLEPMRQTFQVSLIAFYRMEADGPAEMYELPAVADLPHLYLPHAADCPLQEYKKRKNPRLAVITDLVDRRSLERSAAYHHAFGPLDSPHQLVGRISRTAYGQPGATAVVMGRSWRQSRWSDADVERLGRLLPAFEAVLVRAEAWRAAEREREILAGILHGERTAWMALDVDGRLLWRSDACAALFDDVPEALAAGARRFARLLAPTTVTTVRRDGTRCEAVLRLARSRTGESFVLARVGAWAPGAADWCAIGDRFGLTHAEIEVLRALAPGGTNAQIGARLSISPETVRTHLGRIFAKMGVRTRTEAVSRALTGLV